MDEYGQDIHTVYPAFNALNRKAMFFGVPLMALVVCCFVLVMLTMLTLPSLKGRALLFLLLGVPVILGLKTICADDDDALKIYGLEALWLLRRRNAKMWGNTNTVSATKYGRRFDDYQRFLEEAGEKPAVPRRFSAKDVPTRYP